MVEDGTAEGTAEGTARPVSGAADFDGGEGLNRVSGQVFTVFAGGAPVAMGQPACAYPAGAGPAEIEEIYANCQRAEWFETAAVVGDAGASLQMMWQGLDYTGPAGRVVCIENARATASAGLDVTITATFGPPLFDRGVAELPVRFELYPSVPSDGAGAGVRSETFVLEATGASRPL
jgi:hypothetical protein